MSLLRSLAEDAESAWAKLHTLVAPDADEAKNIVKAALEKEIEKVIESLGVSLHAMVVGVLQSLVSQEEG